MLTLKTLIFFSCKDKLPDEVLEEFNRLRLRVSFAKSYSRATLRGIIDLLTKRSPETAKYFIKFC